MKTFPTHRLHELVTEDICYGVVQPGSEFPDGIPLVRVSDLTDGAVSKEHLKKIDPNIDKSHVRSRLIGDELLLACVGSIGSIARADETLRGFNIARAVARVRCNEQVDRHYLYWFFRSPFAQHYFTEEIRQVAQPTLNIRQIEQLEVPVPPLPEQRRIADILDKADAIRRKRKQAIALTDQLLRSTFLEMFGDPVTNPKGWQEATIGELCESGGNIVDGPFGSSLKPEHYTSNGVRVIRNWNIRDDFFDESDFRYVDLMKFEEIRRSEVVAGDILFTTKGTVGDICMMPSLAGESVLSASGTVRLRLPPNGVLLAPFVVWQMVLPSYKQYLHSFEAGSAQQYLNLSAIRKMRLMIPPADYQQRFCDLRLRVLGIKQKQETAQLDASSLFTSLADRAFRGDLSRDREVEGQLSMFNK